MADPFNFDSLRRHTPTYLGLGALKDALPVAGAPEAADVGTAVADVSMEDQVFSDNDCEPSMDLEGFEPGYGAARASEIGDGAKSAPAPPQSMSPALPAEASQPAPASKPAPASPAAQASDSVEPTHKVLSPTQFGAHWALDSSAVPGPQNSYGYEVRMPIPAPWHENLPYTLSTYLQLLFNLGVGLVGVWLVVVAKRDVSAIIRERSDEISLKASWCHQQYVQNRCSPDRVAPHLVEMCLDLERCMDRDPANLRWLSVHASLLSEVLNALIEPLTIRTMVSLALLAFAVGLAVFMVNYLFGFLRARTYFPDKPDARHKQLHISAVPHHAPESKL